MAIRIPYFSKCNAAHIPEVKTGYGCEPLTNLNVLATSIVVEDAPLDIHSIPDMLQPAFSLESAMKSNDGAVRQEAFHQWIGFVCAIILDEGKIVKTSFSRKSLADTSNPLFMRALGRMLEARGIASVYLYTVNVPFPGGDRRTAIGFSYQDQDTAGFTHYCPAAYLRNDLTAMVHAGCFDSENMRFTNPVALISMPAYTPQAMVLASRLKNELVSLPVYLQTLVSNFVASLGVAQVGGTELRPFGGIANVPEENRTIAQWFTPKLLVMQSGWADMYRNCYGDLPVKDENGADANEKVILPLKKEYAERVWGLKSAKVVDIVQLLAVRECFESKKNAVVTRYPGTNGNYRYVLSFQYLGKNYTVTYGEDACVTSRDITVPYTAVWPLREVAGWRDYFVYLRYTDEIALNQMELRPCTANEDDGMVKITEHTATFDRITHDNRKTYDRCIPLSQFPHFMSVYFSGEYMGLILPKEDLTAMPTAAAPTVISIDFGSTNTIAYTKGDSVPSPAVIGKSLLSVCGENDTVETTLDFAPPEAFKKAQYLSMLNTFGMHEVAAADYRIYEESTIPFTEEINVTYDLATHLYLNLKRNTRVGDIVLPIEQSRTRSFMKLISMVYKWNAVQAGASLGDGSLRWRFAYPRSMDSEPLAALKHTFQNTLEGFTVEFCSEAMAVGKCITADSMTAAIAGKGYTAVDKNTGYLIMDIGGGTVDISLWQNKVDDPNASIRSESSLLGVAGAFAIQEAIQRKNTHGSSANTELLWELWNDQVARTNPAVGEFKEQVINALLTHTPLTGNAALPVQLIAYMEARNDAKTENHREQINHLFDTTWCTNIATITKQLKKKCSSVGGDAAYPELNGLIRNLEMYFSMLVFYAGEMTGAAIREKLIRVNQGGTFSLVFAGNGSNMLSFLPDFSIAENAVGVPFRKSFLHDRLKRFFLQGLESCTDATLNVQLIEPVMPKQEVAYGLCAADVITDAPEVTSEWVQAIGAKDITSRAGAFANAWHAIKDQDIRGMMQEKSVIVSTNVDGKRRDAAFRDLIRMTLN